MYEALRGSHESIKLKFCIKAINTLITPFYSFALELCIFYLVTE